MKGFAHILKCAVTAFCVVFSAGHALGQSGADPDLLDTLFVELAEVDNPQWRRVESDILREWSKSGSAAMDLLLKRGEAATEAGDLDAAIAHLTALTDHAPDFAEGWNARATAYFLAGQFGPSLADIRQTLALEPRHFGALSGLGLILEEMGDKPRALEALRAVQAIHPNRPELAGQIARLERELQGTDL